MSEARIVIPFSALRLLLPQDGEVEGFNLKENRWPKNANKGPFEQHERVEFAFGRILRAKQGDRKHERPDPPGMIDRGSHVGFRGGWRVHKEIPVLDDYFDGTFSGKLTLTPSGDVITARTSDFRLEWIGGLVEAVAEAIAGNFERKIAEWVQQEINKYLSGHFRLDFDQLIDKDPTLRRLRDRVSLTVDGTNFIVLVRTD